MARSLRPDKSLPGALRLTDEDWEQVLRSMLVRQAPETPVSAHHRVMPEACERHSAVAGAIR